MRYRQNPWHDHVSRFPEADRVHQVVSSGNSREGRSLQGNPQSSWMQQADLSSRLLLGMGREHTWRLSGWNQPEQKYRNEATHSPTFVIDDKWLCSEKLNLCRLCIRRCFRKYSCSIQKVKLNKRGLWWRHMALWLSGCLRGAGGWVRSGGGEGACGSGYAALADKLYRRPSYVGTIRASAGSFVLVVNGGGESEWRLVAAPTISLVLPRVICTAASIKKGKGK